MASGVSVLIPCFNAERWIAQSIESALDQDWPEKEVIVVDDGSTDGSDQVIRRYDGRVRCEFGPNGGGNVARNRLLQLARFEWLQYLDADDWLQPGKLTGQMAQVERMGGAVDVLYGPVSVQRMGESATPVAELPIPPPHDPWVLLARWYLPQTGAPLWRKGAVEAVGGWKPDQPCCQEHELYLRLLQAGKRFVYSPAGGAVYRNWGKDSVCTRNMPLVHSERLKIEASAERFLGERGELTHIRHQAINQARFEIARGMWQYDPTGATALMQDVRNSDRRFIPMPSDAAPATYRALFRMLGFAVTERIADWRRRPRASL